jgi:hypothetical protein
MQKSFSILKSKELRLIILVIILLFSVVPYAIFKYSYFLLVFFLILEILLISNDKPGISILVLAYSTVIPYVESKTGISYYIPYIGTLVGLFIYIVLKKKPIVYDFRFCILLIPLLMLMAVAWGVKNDVFDEPKIMMLFILSTFGVFCLSFYDELNLRQFFILIDIIFYLTSVFALLEFFFKFSPYQFIFYDLPLDYQLRTKGLLGHPLVYSAFLSMYMALLFTKVIIFKRWNIFNFSLVIFMIVLSASRTGLILTLVSFFLYVILNKAYKNFYFIVGLIILTLIGISAFPYIIDSLDLTAVDRVANASSDQRLGSYPVAVGIFSQNLFGIGISTQAIKHEVNIPGAHYSLNSNYDKSFVVFDNSFLTGLVGYGFLSVFIYVIFINPLRYTYQNFFRDPNLKKYFLSMLFIFAVWFLQNLSFDSIFYFPINSLYFILSALFIKQAFEERKNDADIIQPQENE